MAHCSYKIWPSLKDLLTNRWKNFEWIEERTCNCYNIFLFHKSIRWNAVLASCVMEGSERKRFESHEARLLNDCSVGQVGIKILCTDSILYSSTLWTCWCCPTIQIFSSSCSSWHELVRIWMRNMTVTHVRMFLNFMTCLSSCKISQISAPSAMSTGSCESKWSILRVHVGHLSELTEPGIFRRKKTIITTSWVTFYYLLYVFWRCMTNCLLM